MTEKTALSKRQLDVLQAFADGLDTEKVAKKLNVSVMTVDSHRKNLCKRLGASSVHSAVAEARQREILPPLAENVTSPPKAPVG